MTKTYYPLADGQESIQWSVTQSEGEETDKEFVTIIHEEKISLSKKSLATDKINVTYSYDTSGKMHCVVEDERSGKKTEKNINITETSKSIKQLKEDLDFDIE